LNRNGLDARANVVGVMRFFQNDWAGAAAQFRKVLELQPNQPQLGWDGAWETAKRPKTGSLISSDIPNLNLLGRNLAREGQDVAV